MSVCTQKFPGQLIELFQTVSLGFISKQMHFTLDGYNMSKKVKNQSQFECNIIAGLASEQQQEVCGSCSPGRVQFSMKYSLCRDEDQNNLNFTIASGSYCEISAFWTVRYQTRATKQQERETQEKRRRSKGEISFQFQANGSGFECIQQMCVDDYSFRHFSAIRDKVCRKFVFVNEEDFAKTYYVNISQFEEFGDVALCKILIYLSSKGLNVQNKKFYLPKFMAIIEPFTFCRILFQALDEKQILLRVYPITKSSEQIFAQNEDQVQEFKSETQDDQNYYCRFEELQVKEVMELFTSTQKTNETQMPQAAAMEEEPPEEIMIDENEERSNSKSEDHAGKKPKEAERVIGQVITAVKIWRGLYESKRCNLTNAAKVVGISKKSLDDYFLVLRVGEILGYDFQNNLRNMMGDLRNFIRAQEEKVTGKLGKNVKCFDLVQAVDLDLLMQPYQSNEAMIGN